MPLLTLDKHLANRKSCCWPLHFWSWRAGRACGFGGAGSVHPDCLLPLYVSRSRTKASRGSGAFIDSTRVRHTCRPPAGRACLICRTRSGHIRESPMESHVRKLHLGGMHVLTAHRPGALIGRTRSRRISKCRTRVECVSRCHSRKERVSRGRTWTERGSLDCPRAEHDCIDLPRAKRVS